MVKFNKYQNNNSVVVSFHLEGKRIRKTFKTDSLANDYIKSLRSRIQISDLQKPASDVRTEPVEPSKVESKSFLSVVLPRYIKYLETHATDRDNFRSNRSNLKLAYDWLYDQKIDFLEDIKLYHLQEMQFHWKSGGLKWSSINRRMVNIKSFFQACVDWEIIAADANPCIKLKNLSGSYSKKTFWKGDELKRLIDALGTEARNFLEGLYRHGSRPKDLSNLKWQDVNFRQGYLTTYSKKGGSFELRPHVVYLTESDLSFYRRLKETSTSEYVFTNPTGNKVTTNWFGEQVREARREQNLPDDLVAYALRGMNISMIADMNVAPFQLQAITGHAKMDTTMKHYYQQDSEKVRSILSQAESRKKLEWFSEKVS